jgi:hypothetical protein
MQKTKDRPFPPLLMVEGQLIFLINSLNVGRIITEMVKCNLLSEKGKLLLPEVIAIR